MSRCDERTRAPLTTGSPGDLPAPDDDRAAAALLRRLGVCLLAPAGIVAAGGYPILGLVAAAVAGVLLWAGLRG